MNWRRVVKRSPDRRENWRRERSVLQCVSEESGRVGCCCGGDRATGVEEKGMNDVQREEVNWLRRERIRKRGMEQMTVSRRR